MYLRLGLTGVSSAMSSLAAAMKTKGSASSSSVLTRVLLALGLRGAFDFLARGDPAPGVCSLSATSLSLVGSSSKSLASSLLCLAAAFLLPFVGVGVEESSDLVEIPCVSFLRRMLKTVEAE